MSEMTFHAPVHIGCPRQHECWIEYRRAVMREKAKARIASGAARTYSKDDHAMMCVREEGGCGVTMRWTRDADGNDSSLEPNTPRDAAA